MSSATVSGAYPFAELPLATSAIVLGFLSLLYLTYHWALPRPLPGIPYSKDVLKTVLGDGAEIQQIRRAGGSARNWFGQQTARHRSALVQAFRAAFTKPVLIPSDLRETQTPRFAGTRSSTAPPALATPSGALPPAKLSRLAKATTRISETTKDIVYVFPRNEASDDLRGHQTRQEVVGESTTHPSPKLFHMFHNLTGPIREAFALKTIFGALSMRDELYGYIGAGHDTILRAAYAEAFDAGRQPSVAEITKSSVPYLDAVMEEILHLSAPIRQLVFFGVSGPGFASPSLPVDEAVRGESSKSHRGTTTGSWDHAEPQAFVPERWLNKIVEGGAAAEAEAYHYDAQAGTLLSFGTDLRGASADDLPISSSAPCPGR
ncbi:hypothetical protein DL762_006677 [Monosporascus cannonballus]|uniref:Uncharacterized protein n=1 Tax=Monosporascus cannonballus TaxID=155416 RepID=A0ABY0H1D2_9PEZI|nr:hypothetical protein DL762_006677 [Monosporascus cannonballus]